ncbi:hypothetical protein B0H63DRAFT_458907 [Podospora didyma]|uniref:DUF7730 domain-containing protein n=1 Tax=Podospora didyma TaxID=330526 RepID=A0AAE0P5K5_9PEZI|nr:hypothetical protein B0H63DRAFT_458907 [Podospora didyma]
MLGVSSLSGSGSGRYHHLDWQYHQVDVLPIMNDHPPAILNGSHGTMAWPHAHFEQRQQRRQQAVLDYRHHQQQKEETKNNTKKSTLLNLPVEIRLQIYTWILLQNPMRQAELSPGYPAPTPSAYLVTPAKPSVAEEIHHRCRHHHHSFLSNRPTGSIPTSLLQTCRQIYLEARVIPFHANEFVFPNWFASGLTAAVAFVRGLPCDWQRESMRFVRLEVTTEGYHPYALMHGVKTCKAERVRDWTELCGLWGVGLRGLRLRIAFRGERVLGDDEEWVQGWEKLKGLRWLEVELVGVEAGGGMMMGDEEKVRWCESLGEVINRGRGVGETVDVLCVKGVKA